MITAGLALYGTTAASRPVIERNISADRFCVLPTLIVPMLSLPGFAFPYAISAFIESIFASALATTATSKVPSSETGWKAASVSYGSERNSDAETALPLDSSRSV